MLATVNSVRRLLRRAFFRARISVSQNMQNLVSGRETEAPPAGFQITTTLAGPVKAPSVSLTVLAVRSLGAPTQGAGTSPAMGSPPGVQDPAVPAADVHEVGEPVGQQGAPTQDQHGQQNIDCCFHGRNTLIPAPAHRRYRQPMPAPGRCPGPCGARSRRRP